MTENRAETRHAREVQRATGCSYTTALTKIRAKIAEAVEQRGLAVGDAVKLVREMTPADLGIDVDPMARAFHLRANAALDVTMARAKRGLGLIK